MRLLARKDIKTFRGTIPKRRTLSLPGCLLAVFGHFWLFAAEPPLQNGVIVFPRIEPKELPAAGTERHWIVVGMPGASQVKVANPELAKEITAWLAAHADGEWVLDRPASRTLPELMFEDLRSRFMIKRGSREFLSAPKPTEKAIVNAEFKVLFRELPPAPGLSQITIQVVTEAAAGSEARKDRLPLGQLAPGVTGIGLVDASDLAGSTAGAVAAALRGVAEQAWAISKSDGVVLGVEPDKNVFRKPEEDLRNLYTISDDAFKLVDWVAPRVSFQEGAPLGTGRWELQITGVRILREVKLEVPLVVLDPKGLSPSQLQEKRKAAQQFKEDTELKAGLKLREALNSIQDTVPTSPALRVVLAAVQNDKLLRPPVHAEGKGQTIKFIAGDNRRRYKIDATVEGGWSSEDLVTGKGSFAGSNLLGVSDARKGRVESDSVSFSGGSDVQQGSGTWQVVTTKSLARGATVVRTLSLGGRIRYDHNQALGTPDPTRISLDSRRAGPEYTVEYCSPQRSPSDEAKVFTFGWTGTVGAALSFGRARRREGFAEGQGVLESGSYFGFTLDQQIQLKWRLRPATRGGIGQAHVELHMRGERTPGWLSYEFRKATAYGEAELKFGASRSQDLLVRYRVGMATASKGAPLFELPRLGGADVVRGVEEGERIGRKLGYTQFTGGPSIEYFMTWLGKKRAVDARLGPIKLSDTYLTFFCDRGAALTKSSLIDLLWPTGAAGYGAEVEIHNFSVGPKRGRLTIGYGYSPDSGRHRHGVPLAALSIDLN